MPSKWLLPPFSLQKYIATYILSDYGINELEDASTYMYPIGSAVLCFSLDNPPIYEEISTGQIIKHAKFNFIHQFKYPRHYKVIASPTKVLHVVFKPYGAYKLLSIPQNCSFDEHGTSLIHIPIDKIKDLLTRIEDAGYNSDQIITLVNEWLVNKLTKNDNVNTDRIEHACTLIEANLGNLSIETLAQKVWLSKRTLEYQFQERIGLSPKLYSRIRKFNLLLAGMKDNESPDWQEIVFKYNYFDQAHFIKEFRCFSGNTPAHLTKNRAILS